MLVDYVINNLTTWLTYNIVFTDQEIFILKIYI